MLFTPSATSFSGTSILEQSPWKSRRSRRRRRPIRQFRSTVTFSYGLTAAATIHLNPATSNVAVDGSGSVTGNIRTPGFGQGGDGIPHHRFQLASTLNTAIIENNTVTGYGGYGIHIETAGTATARQTSSCQNNTVQSQWYRR